MPAIPIRPATAADVPLILALIQELADFERLSHEVVADEDGLRAQLFGARPAAEVLIAEDAQTQEPTAFALFFPTFSTFVGKRGIHLEDLYVRAPFRGQGIGSALLQRLAQIAIERDCGRLEWTVLDWNEQAIGFYRKLGARVLDDWRICRVDGQQLQSLAA